MGLNTLLGDVGLLEGDIGLLDGERGLPICELGLLDGVHDTCLLSIEGDMGRPDLARLGDRGRILENSVMSVD